MKSLLVTALVLFSTASFSAPVEKHDPDCKNIISGNPTNPALVAVTGGNPEAVKKESGEK